MPLELLFLGTGTSAGVPMIGCHCPVCQSTDPRDQRTRPSVLIRHPRPDGAPAPALNLAPGWDDTAHPEIAQAARPVQVLIDTAQELRLQVVRHRIDYVDAVFFTHNHADHVFGLDDLRRFNVVTGQPLDVFAETRVADWFRRTFEYVFQSHRNVNKSFVPSLILRMIEPGQQIELIGATWTPLRLHHGRLPILGFRIDQGGHSIAYCTDVSTIPPETYPLLDDLDVLVIDGLRYRHHPTHLTVDQALQEIEMIRPKRAYLTHIAHDIMHAELEASLPEHVFLAFDGLAVRCGERVEERHEGTEVRRHEAEGSGGI